MPTTKAPHIVLLACPGAGHVLPMAVLAKRLAEDHGFTATIITYSSLSLPTQTHSTLFASLPSSVTTATLPAVPLDDLPADARVETRMLITVTRGLPDLRALLADLVRDHRNVVAFLADMFCAQALPLAADLGVPPYIVYLSNLMLLSLMLHLPELDATTTCEYRDLPDLLRLPGCVPLRGADLLDTIQDRSNPAYALMVEMTRHFVLADGFVVNTFDEMEHDAVAAFQEMFNKGVCPPVYPVGPFVRPCSDDTTALDNGCLRWLESQPDGSVLYVCFGSGGTLSVEQTGELAAGLEASGHRFLWVMHFPSDKDSSAAYFDAPDHLNNDPLSFLPEGFTERTKGVGLCVPEWAPQVEVLHHRAVGGFLSHCGWNSTLEAVEAGVPVLAWPLFAEQRMNAVMLEERAGMALRPAGGRGRVVVSREEVAEVVRELMEGEKGEAARKKVAVMKKKAAESLAPEGPSRKALAAIVSRWKKSAHGGVGNEPSSQ